MCLCVEDHFCYNFVSEEDIDQKLKRNKLEAMESYEKQYYKSSSQGEMTSFWSSFLTNLLHNLSISIHSFAVNFEDN